MGAFPKKGLLSICLCAIGVQNLFCFLRDWSAKFILLVRDWSAKFILLVRDWSAKFILLFA